MTNIKYSKRFKLRNGERVDFCPECDYHITDTVNNSDSVYCPKCGQRYNSKNGYVNRQKIYRF